MGSVVRQHKTAFFIHRSPIKRSITHQSSSSFLPLSEYPLSCELVSQSSGGDGLCGEVNTLLEGDTNCKFWQRVAKSVNPKNKAIQNKQHRIMSQQQQCGLKNVILILFTPTFFRGLKLRFLLTVFCTSCSGLARERGGIAPRDGE